jgi:hypothetical protein
MADHTPRVINVDFTPIVHRNGPLKWDIVPVVLTAGFAGLED